MKFFQDSRNQNYLLGLLICVAVIVAYQPMWHAGFIWDDDKYVTNNPLLSAPDGLKRIWFSMQSPSQYFPLTYTTFRIERSLWGYNPAYYHCVNILLHAVNALLLWQLLLRLSVPGAWLAAAIFALHPVQVESVAWISELKTVLSLFFMLLALLAWVGFIQEQPTQSWPWYGKALLFYALALCAKTTACTLPVALLLILWLKAKPINRWRLMEVAPFVALGIGMGLLTMWWERFHQGTQGKLFSMGFLERDLVASHAFWFYVGKLVWPSNLTFSYPRWTINPADPFTYGWLLAGVGLFISICFVRRFVGRSIEVAMLFYLVTLSPLLGFVMLYTFRYSFVADHYQYAACIGPIALVAAGIATAFGSLGKGSQLFKPVLCGVLLLTLGTLTWRQCAMYADYETLMRATIQRNPDSSMAHNNLANILLQKEQLDEAIIHFQKALEIDPDIAEPHNNLGNALLQKGQLDEALIQFQKSVDLFPDFAGSQYNLGLALFQKGRLDEAAVHFQKAVEIDRRSAPAQGMLGLVFFRKGQLDDAISHLQKSVEINPKSAKVQNNLGLALLQNGRVDEAIVCFETAEEIDPNFAEAYNNIGLGLFQKGQIEDAINQYQKSLAVDPTYAEAYKNLGLAFYREGRADEAIKTAQQGLQQAFAQTNTSLVNIIQIQIKSYLTNSHPE